MLRGAGIAKLHMATYVYSIFKEHAVHHEARFFDASGYLAAGDLATPTDFNVTLEMKRVPRVEGRTGYFHVWADWKDGDKHVTGFLPLASAVGKSMYKRCGPAAEAVALEAMNVREFPIEFADEGSDLVTALGRWDAKDEIDNALAGDADNVRNGEFRAFWAAVRV